MPGTHHVPGNALERAEFHASITDTRAQGRQALEAVRRQVARHRLSVASLAIERRILREDYDHWDDDRA